MPDLQNIDPLCLAMLIIKWQEPRHEIIFLQSPEDIFTAALGIIATNMRVPWLYGLQNEHYLYFYEISSDRRIQRAIARIDTMFPNYSVIRKDTEDWLGKYSIAFAPEVRHEGEDGVSVFLTEYDAKSGNITRWRVMFGPAMSLQSVDIIEGPHYCRGPVILFPDFVGH